METPDTLDLLVATGVAVVLLCAPRLNAADSAGVTGQARQTPADIEWPDASRVAQPGAKPNPTLQSIVVRGDATKHELYSIMFKAGPGTQLKPHSHPDERSCFVLQGTWYFGYGTKWDDAGLKALPAGSRYSEPANAPHFAGTKDQDAVVECTAVGPSGTKEVE